VVVLFGSDKYRPGKVAHYLPFAHLESLARTGIGYGFRAGLPDLDVFDASQTFYITSLDSSAQEYKPESESLHVVQR